MAAFDQFVDVNTGRVYMATYLQSVCYRIGQHELATVTHAPGWCNDCETVVAVEHLPSESEIEHETRELEAIVNGGTSSYSYFFDSADAALEKLAERKRYWAALRYRTSSARCLECYGTDIVPLPTAVGEEMDLPNGLCLEYDSYGFADIGPEPSTELTIDGIPIGENAQR